jgi:shikimate kinase
MHIVIVGYMGSGKSTVGRLLAGRLGRPFIDLDHYIQEALVMPVPEIFRQKGELFFRKKEHQYLKEVLAGPADAVIALGGGTPCYSGNMDLVLKHTSRVCYLMLSVTELVERLGPEKEGRPLIKAISGEELPAFIGKHLFERRQCYEKAPFTVACAGKSPQHIAKEIEGLLA